MSHLQELEILADHSAGDELPMPHALAQFYGALRLEWHPGRPHVISNFVSTIDGVVTLGIPGKSGGDAISGNNEQDSAVMGMLRAAADAIIVGATNLQVSAQHIWTAEHVHPDLAYSYGEFRKSLGKQTPPLNVIVTDRANIDFSLPVFQSGQVPVLVVTNKTGAEKLRKAHPHPPTWTTIVAVKEAGFLSAEQIIAAVLQARPKSELILVEGGPLLMGPFFAEKLIDELFLTISPQLAGRDNKLKRPGLVDGMVLAPDIPTWAKLASVRKGENHLFLRYRFD